MILKTPVVANLIFLGFLFILKCGLTSIADESGNWSSKTINMILAMNLILTPTTYWATVLADSASGVPASGQPMQTARKSKAAEKLRKKLQCRIFRERETNLTDKKKQSCKKNCLRHSFQIYVLSSMPPDNTWRTNLFCQGKLFWGVEPPVDHNVTPQAGRFSQQSCRYHHSYLWSLLTTAHFSPSKSRSTVQLEALTITVIR